MIRVRILLCEGHVYETFCSADARLIEDLRRIVALGANATGMAQWRSSRTARCAASPFRILRLRR